MSAVAEILGPGGRIAARMANYEHRQEQLAMAEVVERLEPGAVVLSDNSHATDVLSRWSEAGGRRFLYFAERPKDHWYAGAGIGVSLDTRSAPGTAVQSQ